MTLADRLANPPEPAQPSRGRSGDHAEGLRYDGGQAVEATVNITGEIPADEKGWREAIVSVTGLALPEDREVVLTQVRYWGPQDDKAKFAYCRFSIRDRKTPVEVDAVELLKQLRKGSGRRQRKPLKTWDDGARVLSWNDWQTGKAEGGGTPALAERLDRQFEQATDDQKWHALPELVIVGGGDIIEGCSIFPNQAFQLDGDRRTQVRNATALILEGLDRLAPLFSRVRVMAVGGNHGENRIEGHKTNRHDNDDCAVFEHAAIAAARDPRLQHVEFFIAQEDPSITLDVQGWILGTTHGQAYGKTQNGAIEQKVYKWYSQMAAGRRPVGDSQVLLTHHYHHEASADWGACRWQQTPANDGGSGHFLDFSGRYSEPGMLSFVMTPEHRYLDHHILL